MNEVLHMGWPFACVLIASIIAYIVRYGIKSAK